MKIGAVPGTPDEGSALEPEIENAAVEASPRWSLEGSRPVIIDDDPMWDNDDTAPRA
jgi:hypothetical protein